MRPKTESVSKTRYLLYTEAPLFTFCIRFVRSMRDRRSNSRDRRRSGHAYSRRSRSRSRSRSRDRYIRSADSDRAKGDSNRYSSHAKDNHNQLQYSKNSFTSHDNYNSSSNSKKDVDNSSSSTSSYSKSNNILKNENINTLQKHSRSENTHNDYHNDDGETENKEKKVKLFLVSDSTKGGGGSSSSVLPDDDDDDDEYEDLPEGVTEVDEEAQAAKLAEDRRKRREEIMKKHQQQSKGEEAGEDGSKAVDKGAVEATGAAAVFTRTLQTASLASDGIAAMVIADITTSAAEANFPTIASIVKYTDDNDEAAQLERERLAVAEDARLNNKDGFTFDMFSASPSDLERVGNRAAAIGHRATKAQLVEGDDPHLQSNWDDGEGYYRARVGEVISDRYQTLGVVGKGVFSTVLKCSDLEYAGEGGHEHVAIKLIRNNDTMRKAAEKEKSILLAISERDQENKRHCIRLLGALEFRSHVAFVFEYQHMNLREALKKFGKDVGINIGAVRIYARQLFIALRHLASLQIVHADIKLDNILCSGDLKQVKLCDFGSAFRELDTDNDPTPYLVSRFYRAPEIILGFSYDRSIDLWSVAVCLYELFTGHVMFAGRTNNEMLRIMMSLKGRLSNKQIKAHLRAYEALKIEPHFCEDMRFRQYDVDPITNSALLRLVDINQPTKDLISILRTAKAGGDDSKLVSSLTDLLDKSLALDPGKRLSVHDALKHPFFSRV